jgi:hypothetical protein
MANEATQPSSNSSLRTSSRKIWIYAFCIILLLGGFAYFSLISRSSSYINHDFYRILYEASNTLNENLHSIESMHKNLESEVSIRSIFPSYQRTYTQISNNTQRANKNAYQPVVAEEKTLSFRYFLQGQKIIILSNTFNASLELKDVLPNTQGGFSQFLFADKDGKVITNIGGEKTISIVEMKSISQQLLIQNKQSFLNFDSKGNHDSGDPQAVLPSYSSHVDLTLSYGEFRIFIFPFALSMPLNISQDSQVNADSQGSPINRLYLVGLLPQHELTAKSSGQWNISLLVVSVVSLLFMWALLRLILLPENHSITRFYRSLSQLASYSFYVVLVALVLAYLTKSGLQAYKDQQAKQYAASLSQALNQDLDTVFTKLATYRPFYQQVVHGLNALQALSNEDLAMLSVDWQMDLLTNHDPQSTPIWNYRDIHAVYNNALTALAQSQFQAYPSSVNEKPLPSLMSSVLTVSSIINDYGPVSNLRSDSSFESIIESTPWTSHIAEQNPANQLRLVSLPFNKLGEVSFYAGWLQANIDHSAGVFNSFVDKTSNTPTIRTPILSVFAMDETGNANLPSVYFQESNAAPQAFPLAYRDYFKKVRDFRGWQLPHFDSQSGEPAGRFRNVYIQRLLNLNDGTRGTTISMPMYQHNEPSQQDMAVAGYVLGADVILPSVSLAPPADFDFTFMVVDRNSGEVLFHSDEDRSLVENLFYVGQSKSYLSQWIKAGMDASNHENDAQIDGYYHGEPGLFTLYPTNVDDWAMVVFSPKDSLDSYMTNQFMYILVTFVLLLTLIFILIKGVGHLASGQWIKRRLGIAQELDLKRSMLTCTTLITANYCLYYIGQLLTMSFPNVNGLWWFSLVIPLVGLLSLFWLIYHYYLRHFCPHDKSHNHAVHLHLCKGARIFVYALMSVSLLHFIYLQLTAALPLQSLQGYYKQQYCNGINKERNELTDMALNRYPNSVTQRRISPFELLPIDDSAIQSWRDILLGNSQPCVGQLSSVEPQDYPKLSTLVGASLFWKWANTYLLDTRLDNASSPIKLNTNVEYGRIALSILCLIALIWVWYYFNRKILWPRIYCPNGFLRHISRLCQFATTIDHEQPNQRLIIQVDTVKLSGVGIALLLRNQLNTEKDKQPPEILPGFNRLYQLSPCLQLFAQNNTFLPNLKIDVTQSSETGLLAVRIWDIETCLEKVDFRQHLLDLIMEIKSLTLANTLDSFTIFSGFRSLRRVKMKDSLAAVNSSLLEHAEYMSWSECLMDFSVKVDKSLFGHIDTEILCHEVIHLPELKFLLDNVPADVVQHYQDHGQQADKLWKNNNNIIADREWSTIHYILLHADALYRFKWESCSSAEKLALYNLAKQHRLNPSNTEMIEHLAINGMLKVSDEHLTIINKSFSHFVLHAETSATLAQLVQEGEAGVWKSYRLPLGMLIVLIIGGIALTSGQSIFIIMASLAGVLGTIGSLTNSASMLKGQFKD